MPLILSNSPLFFDISDFPLYPPFCERLAFSEPSIFHVKLLMLFVSERSSFSPLDCSNPNHITPWCPTGTLEIQSLSARATDTSPGFCKHLTGKTTFGTDNTWLDGEKGSGVGSWKSSRQSVYFYFLFSMWIACTSQYHSIHVAAKTTYALASFPRPRGILLHLQWLSTFFTPNCP